MAGTIETYINRRSILMSILWPTKCNIKMTRERTERQKYTAYYCIILLCFSMVVDVIFTQQFITNCNQSPKTWWISAGWHPCSRLRLHCNLGWLLLGSSRLFRYFGSLHRLPFLSAGRGGFGFLRHFFRSPENRAVTAWRAQYPTGVTLPGESNVDTGRGHVIQVWIVRVITAIWLRLNCRPGFGKIVQKKSRLGFLPQRHLVHRSVLWSGRTVSGTLLVRRRGKL